MNPEIVQSQSWRYKTIVVIKRQQQTTISNKQTIRVITLFFSIFVSLLIYLNHWQSIFGCTRHKIQFREYQGQIQQNSTKPQK